MLKKAEDVEDTADQSAIKLRAQQQPSNALVLDEPQPVNGAPPPLKVPSVSGSTVSISLFQPQLMRHFFVVLYLKIAHTFILVSLTLFFLACLAGP